MDDETSLACDACNAIDRRSFLSAATLAAVTLALAACSDSPTSPDQGGSGSIKVSDYPALASVNGVATLRLGGAPVAVVRTGADTYLALSLVCPHQGATVGVSGSGFLCPRHGARFSLNGTWTGGQPTTNLRSYQTSYDQATGTLTIG